MGGWKKNKIGEIMYYLFYYIEWVYNPLPKPIPMSTKNQT